MLSPEDADFDTAALLLQLRRLGVASSAQLQVALSVSQPTASRLLARAAPQVVTLGRGKRSRYALPQDILGAAAQQPLHWVDAQGRVERLGTLTALHGQRVHAQVGPSEWLTQGQAAVVAGAAGSRGLFGSRTGAASALARLGR